jgi:O-succinylbenzoic acid--CoA ligase
LDGAINSGGETVFPDQVQQKLMELARAADLPLVDLMLLDEPDPIWGARLVALVRLCDGEDLSELEPVFVKLAQRLPSCQRPRRWIACPKLERTDAGKFQRSKWIKWLNSC